MAVFERSVELPVSAEAAFAWHTRPGAFARLMPPWETARIRREASGLAVGERAELDVRIGPFWRTWHAEHTRLDPPHMFQDVQRSGPFKEWVHTHRFEATGMNRCRMTDHIEYQLPLGVFGRLFGSAMVESKLHRMFAYRHNVTRNDLHLHSQHLTQSRKRVVISGASGLLGKTLCAMLNGGGHTVVRLVRPGQALTGGDISWDPNKGEIDFDALSRFEPDAIINLSGSNVGAGRWTPQLRSEIRESRVRSTKTLAGACAQLHRPLTLLSASGVSFYGTRADAPVDESAQSGDGFLAEVTRAWEQATQEAGSHTRIVIMRIGWVLSPRGGPLKTMLPIFRAGLGGRIGSGKQFVPWISIDDCCGAIVHALMTASVDGPVNIVAPQPVTNSVFSQELARAIRRPCLLACPAWACELAAGELASEGPLASHNVVPGKLLNSGYLFRHTDVRGALGHVLGASELGGEPTPHAA